MNYQNLRISELPDAGGIRLDDLLAISRNLTNSPNKMTKKLSMEDLINGIRTELNIEDVINEYLYQYLNELTGSIKKVYLGDEQLTISRDGVLIIPDKAKQLMIEIENVRRLINEIQYDLNLTKHQTTINQSKIEQLRHYLHNDYKNVTLEVVKEYIDSLKSFIELPLFFKRSSGNNFNIDSTSSIYKKVQLFNPSAYQLLPNDTHLPSNEVGTYIIIDLSNSFFETILDKYTSSDVHEITNNNLINEDDYYIMETLLHPVFVNSFYNNNTKELVLIFKNTFDFKGVVFIK